MDLPGTMMQVLSFTDSLLSGPDGERIFPGPVTVREQQQEVNSSDTSARAMIGFQYTPITITYSDCIQKISDNTHIQ
jgi:hypothetical protein